MIQNINIDDSIKFLTSDYFVQDLNQEYFRLQQCPEYFGLGYNSFLFSINSRYFRGDTNIVVKLFDSYGNTISLNTSNILQKKFVRIYSLITDDLEIGTYTLCLVGCIQSTTNGIKIPKSYENIYNVRFKKEIYINPSVSNISTLRLSTIPSIDIRVGTKSTFQYEIDNIKQIIPISYIKINEQYKNFFQIGIDTNSITNSNFAPVFNQKYLTYQIRTSSIQQMKFTDIFSGQLETSSISGTIYGRFYTSNSFTCSGQFTLYNGSIFITNSILTPVQNMKIYGYNSIVEIDYDNMPSSRDAVNTVELTIKDCVPKHESIVPGIWNLNIDKMYQPIYFQSGNITSSKYSGSIYTGSVVTYNTTISNVFDINSGYISYQKYIKSKELIFQKLKTGYYSYPILITGSFEGEFYNVEISSIGILSGSYISQTINKQYNVANSNSMIDLYSQNILLDPTSLFYGTVSGIGSAIGVQVQSYSNILTVTIGTTTTSTTILNNQVFSMYGTHYKYCGFFKTADITSQYLRGFLYSGSLLFKHTNNIEVITQLATISNYIDFKMIMQGGKFCAQNCSYFNIGIQTSKYLPQINLRVSSSYASESIRSNSSNYIYINSDIEIPIHPRQTHGGTVQILDMEGCVYVTDFTGTCSGLYQMSTNSIQLYSIYNINLISSSYNFFNTNQIYFFNGIYNTAYVPIAIKYINTDTLYDRLTLFNNTKSVYVQYSFYNSVSNKQILDVNNFNLQLNISNLSVYSGYVKYIEIQYRDSLTETFQYLNNIQLPYNCNTQITQNISVPYNLFKNQSIDLQFRFVDGNNKYSIEDYNILTPNVKLQNYLQEDILIDIADIISGYEESGGGSGTVTTVAVESTNGIISTVSDLSGNAVIYLGLDEISVTNITTSGQILSNVQDGIPPFIINSQMLVSNLNADLLDGKHANQFAPIGHSHPGIQEVQIVFISPIDYFEYQIGTTQSNIPITWSIGSQHTLISQSCTLSYATYPSETVWIQSSSFVIDSGSRSILLHNISSSIKFDLYCSISTTSVISGSIYIYMRNALYCGTSSNLSISQSEFLLLNNKQLNNDYLSYYQLNPSSNDYIYFACPSWMTEPYSPSFIVGHVQGGFSHSANVLHTNTSSYIEQYSIYRSYNKNLGKTYLKVQNPFYINTDIYETFNTINYITTPTNGLNWKNTYKLTSSYLKDVEYIIYTRSSTHTITDFNNLSVFINGLLKIQSGSNVSDWDYKSGSSLSNIIFNYDIDYVNTYITYIYTG